MNVLIAIVGQTATGKSRLAVELARRTDGAILSVDSRCIYRFMDIGTAKPTLSDRSLVVHHGLDLCDPTAAWSVDRFVAYGQQVIESARRRSESLILVGGTGYWMRALLGGGFSQAVPPDRSLRSRLASTSPHELARHLERLDPAALARIDRRNPRRLIRAIEVVEFSGRPYAEAVRSWTTTDCRVIGLAMDWETLRERIAARNRAMIELGWVEEVRWLVGRGYEPSLPAMSSIGYREMVPHVQGSESLDRTLTAIDARCRRLARGQRSWFRRDDPAIEWFDAATVAAEDIL
ncbi:MAG: tRNA (adenosine(37)-N6)-dimethylallyltransferase MiaA [Chloroflexi bacterium]|nr:tRNA (adenosine(37)-N6)-dimethylallyltransferase MiaA [Chloroflexota bacterium]